MWPDKLSRGDRSAAKFALLSDSRKLKPPRRTASLLALRVADELKGSKFTPVVAAPRQSVFARPAKPTSLPSPRLCLGLSGGKRHCRCAAVGFREARPLSAPPRPRARLEVGVQAIRPAMRENILALRASGYHGRQQVEQIWSKKSNKGVACEEGML